MNQETEFLLNIKQKGATIADSVDTQQTYISIANTNLQTMRCAMLPNFLINLYMHINGIYLGSACIFGPIETTREIDYPLSSIVDINKSFMGNTKLMGKTIFGRNDLFLFATDALGTCYMLDNTTLSVLRTYDNPYKAMLDCIIIGKI